MSVTVRLSYACQTGNFWIDNGLVYLLWRWGEGEHRVEDVISGLLDEIVQPTGNKGQYYDEKTGELREYEKRNWIEPANLFIKVFDKPPKVEIGEKQYYMRPPQFVLDPKPSKETGICDICGEVAPFTDAKMWTYPFVVDPGKFGNFYSGAKRGLRLCARCALAGLAGYLTWWWRKQGRDALHFFLFHTELRELERLHREVLRPLQVAGERSGNVRPAFSGRYLHETALGTLFFLFSHISSSPVLSEEARQLLEELFGSVVTERSPVVLYAVTGVPGQAFDMKMVREFSRLQEVYRLYESWKAVIERDYSVPNPHQFLVDILSQFWARRNNELDTLWRDRIAQAVLEFGDPLPTLEGFLFDVRAKEKVPLQRGTVKILVNHYLKEVFGMEEQFIRTLSGFGHTLGATAHEKGEMGLLYALRNAKNVDEFYRVLNDVQFRLDLTVPEPLLQLGKGERIAGSSWRRVKHMLAIYSMNAYLRKEGREEQTKTTEEG